jgi:hypothetical protein
MQYGGQQEDPKFVAVRRVGRVWVSGIISVIASSLVFAPALAWAQQASPNVAVVQKVEGTPTGDTSFSLTATCKQASGGPDELEFEFVLAGNAKRTLTPSDLPGLTAEHECVIRTAVSNGATSTYQSSQRPLSDGTRLSAQPGVLDRDGFASAPAFADGQTITVTQTFSGDLLLRRTSDSNAFGSNKAALFQIKCSGGTQRTVTLQSGEQQLLAGLTSGQTCTASSLSGSARFNDNSGNPTDGSVTILTGRADCLDLRALTSNCRAVITVSATDESVDSEQLIPTTAPDQPPTTIVEATAMPAVTASPATPVNGSVAYTG